MRTFTWAIKNAAGRAGIVSRIGWGGPVIGMVRHTSARIWDKCRVWLRKLNDHGHELRRPDADYLRDGNYELRVGFRGQNYRMLYFYAGRELVVVSHGLVKERIVPPKEIDLAVRRMNQFQHDPATHTYREEL